MRRPFLRPTQESAACRMNASDRPLFEPLAGLEDMAPDTLALGAFVLTDSSGVLWRIARKTH